MDNSPKEPTFLDALEVIIVLLKAIAANMNIDTAKELEAFFADWDAEDNGYED